MSSAGLRRGALPSLRIGDLEKIDKYSLYKISVYKKELEAYFTFCTPECSKILDQYFDYRARLGEKLHSKSLVIRKEFSTLDAAMICLIEVAIRPRSEKKENNKDQRTSLMQTHGFRKFFDTTCTLNGLDKLYVDLLMGHDTGLKAHYFKPTSQDLLEGNDHKLGYVSVIDYLTINEENRLRRQNEMLKVKKSEIEQLKEEVQEYRTIKPSLQAMKEQMDELKRVYFNSINNTDDKDNIIK
jgi:hypothetical protein